MRDPEPKVHSCGGTLHRIITKHPGVIITGPVELARKGRKKGFR